MSEKQDTPRTGHMPVAVKLAAMAANYSEHHQWDKLDREVCVQALAHIAELESLNADLLRALEVEAEWHESESEELAKFSMEARIKNHRDRAASIRAALAKAQLDTKGKEPS